MKPTDRVCKDKYHNVILVLQGGGVLDVGDVQ
jgi:hypothetical protein